MTKKVISLDEGVTLSGDARLQAEVNLRLPHLEALGGDSVLPPPMFRETAGGLESLGGAPEVELGVLEVSGVSDPSLVTPQNPLVLTLEESPVGDDLILPYTFDGEFYLPLGNSRTENGRTEITIEQLPMPDVDPALESLESLGAVSILFQKIASDYFGTDFNYPRLAAATVRADGSVHYEADVKEVRRLVAGANRILLYVHGLFGTSEGYVASSVAAEVQDGPAPKLADRYDLILAYDYESVNTAIEWTARQLRWALEEVGLGPNHGKTLHIVAHSMGGLVSRWFIEMEGGHEIVQHLVTAGTPHLGSPWSKIHDLAGTLLSLGLNSLSTVVWPMKIFGSLVKATEAIDVTIDQMDPGSMFMQLLGTNRDPRIPMTVIAGNTSVTPAAMQAGPDGKSAVERLFERLEKMKLLQKAAGLAFLGKPNDMMVSVESAFGVPEKHARIRRVEIPCDHMSFFLLSDSLRKMDEALES